LQTLADLGQFSRREVNSLSLYFRALVLGISALLLGVSALAKRLKLIRHLLDGPSKVGQLASGTRYVLFGGHRPGY
jgi:hypothetical protein